MTHLATEPVRLRKAWRVKVDWSDDADVVYARSAGAARYSLKLTLGDCYPDLRFDQIKAHRLQSSDMVLPAPHRLVAELSSEERHRILHAYGYNGSWSSPVKAGYRSHYCCEATDAVMHRLAWELGLFAGPFGEGRDGDSGMWAGVFYYLSDLGKTVARSMLPLYPGDKEPA